MSFSPSRADLPRFDAPFMENLTLASEPVEVTVARLDGKLDAMTARLSGQLDNLTTKLDANAGLLTARIDAGDRENAQRLALLAERVDSQDMRQKATDQKVESLGLFNAKLIGAFGVVGVVGGGAGAALVKVLGG